MVRITVDRKRARRVLGTLYQKFLVREFPYNMRDAQPPQVSENMPKNGFASELDRACFLFLVCLYMRGKIKSHTAMRGYARVYEKYPELFSPRAAAGADPDFVENVLVAHGLGFSVRQNARFWIENMRRLDETWRSDPRNIFVDATSYQELCKRICNAKTRRKRYVDSDYEGFQGFQKKMTSMLIYFFMDAGLVPQLPFPLPVDFHVLRILLANEVVTVTGQENGNLFTDAVMERARSLSLEFCKKHDVDFLHMSEFVWLFSRTLCSRHPGNISNYIGERKGRQTIIYAKTITWAKGQRRTYNLTCGQCPIESTCLHCIPAAPYYNYGKIVLRDRRDKPPQKHLFPPFKVVHPEKRQWKKEPKPTETLRPDSRQIKLFRS